MDSIQAALQGCKHREAFNFDIPILGATRQKLVAAYRNRAAILHFAGHGDDRSLSFILDQGVVVSTTPIIARQLAEVLRNFPYRVRLCVLNTCDSSSVAKHLVDTHAVDAAIGWSDKLADATAIAFSGSLYGCLGDGLTLSRSVTLSAQSHGLEEIPVLYTDEGVDPNESMFIERTEE